MKRFVSMLGAGAILASLIAAPASAATTEGTWSQYPTSGTAHEAALQPPLVGGNTDHWSAKSRGGIPVMFTLSSAATAAVFESIGSDGDTANDFAWISFSPTSLTFNQITTLKTDYEFTLGDCHGGSLRWSVRTDASHSLFIYYGAYPQFGNGGVDGCTGAGPGGVDQSGTNMIGLGDLRYDTSQYPGGTFYDTYAHAQTLMGDLPLTSVSLVVDGGWAGDQRLAVSDTTVNDNVYQWDAGGSGDLAATCDLPDATLEVGLTDPVVDGDISEAPVQASLGDEGNAFRVVDCKYQYILSIPSLDGPGTYYLEIRIGGVTAGTGTFVLNARASAASSAAQAHSNGDHVQGARGVPRGGHSKHEKPPKAREQGARGEHGRPPGTGPDR